LGGQTRRVAVKPSDIRCLALEGGGGKGLAYLGALEALEELKALKQLKVVAGASAGAITAMLLAVGMTAKDIRQYLQETNFDTFYDPPKPRMRPRIGQPYTLVQTDTSDEKKLRKVLSYSSLEYLIGLILGIPPVRLWFSLAFGDERIPKIAADLKAVRAKEVGEQPFKVLLDNLLDYVTYLPADMGLFSGQAAREEFDKVIRQAIRKKHPSMAQAELDKRPAITFQDLTDLFPDSPKLVLTGSNVSTGRTQLFSKDHTPDFPVADATRISMSLPFLYKPYVITTRRDEKWPPCGTYVDGGWWNNISYRDTGFPASQTLALRLEVVPPDRVATVGQLFGKALNQGLFGTGESQVLPHYEANIILLDVRPLSLIKFKPPPADLDKVTKRSRRRVFFAFGMLPPQKDWDWRDDIESSSLAQANPACELGSFASGAWSSD
jgi:predicted acylesterase/phospholipase RssA